QLLAILVFEDGEVQNRLLETDRPFTDRQLERAANYLNREYAGLRLTDIRGRIVADLGSAKQQMDRLMEDAIEVAGQAFSAKDASDVVLSGQTNLMQYREMADLDLLKSLFDAFQEKREILYLLEQCVGADGVRLFIGEECGSEVLGHCSVVSAPYQIDDEVVGVLGVIGPTRMAYDRVISVVQATAGALTSILNQKS
ncbi:MAG: HrcA family transcriptional regulator, partial [Xanthomonadales bacterium]|nr:HrcA family transcriptional regulator [Xanthomonadales bacterium]